MNDLLYLGLGLALFAVAAFFVRGSDRPLPEKRP